MGAILGGAGAAVAWAFASACAARSSRAVGPWVALAWVLGFGLLVILPLLALSDRPQLGGDTSVWLVVSGAANVGGLLVTYRALRIGPVGVVAPIVGTEGGVTALIAIFSGQSVSGVQAGALAAVLVGVGLVAWHADPPAELVGEPVSHSAAEIREAALLAVTASLIFGLGLYATGRAGDDVPLAWAVLPARLLGFAVLTAPLALRGRLRIPREVVPFVVAGGCLEVLGFISFTAGATQSIAITAVLTSLTGAVAAGLGRVFYAERLSHRQLAGVALLVAAVATLGAVT